MRRVEIAGFIVSLALLSRAVVPASGLFAWSDSQNAGGHARGSHLNGDGFLKVDGTPRLMIGFYELPKEDEKLRELAENGFNLVRTPQDVKALDRVHSQNLYAWVCLDSAARLSQGNDKGEQKLAGIVDGFKDHPALLVWELPDEAVWNIWWSRSDWTFSGRQSELRKQIEAAEARASESDIAKWSSLLEKANDQTERGLWKQAEETYDGLWKELGVTDPHPDWKMSECSTQAATLTDEIARGCQVVRQHDPRHIIWQNHAPRNSIARLRKYNEAVDAAGCDIYPVPANYGVGHSDLRDMNLSSVGAYTDRMREAAPDKSVWMVLQGFGWRDLNEKDKKDSDPAKGRRPDLRETCFMAYDAIVHGANAVLYWGTDYIEKDSSLWGDLMRVARELRALEPAITGSRPDSAPRAVADETYGSIDSQGPQLMLRKAGEDWVLIAVNEYSQGVSFTVSGLPGQLEGKTLYRLYSPETHIIKSGIIRDGIRGLGVHVYATSRRFEAR